ncbi:MAG: MotA/TolQ/ExbB proton channel family protein [Verrucomicrobia bacterium]|nr:MotA/TolQ/ExbB proton channel family protein [Verrucomicrobiota bacterium]
MLKKLLNIGLLATVMFALCAGVVAAQDDVAVGAGDAALELSGDAAQAAATEDDGGASFWKVMTSGGILGIILWLGLGACSVAGVALIVDSFITIRQKKIVPTVLVTQVREAMEQGDVMKALQLCEQEPGPLANILSAGFSNVQEGFEAIQDSVGVAADLESEKLLQRVNYLNVVGNLSPMLGLLGTVQGMIFAFATLGTQSAGAAQQAMLALNISMALSTTAAGLFTAVPAVAFFYLFRNRAMKIILGMEALTLDLIKSLRNVEVVEE